MKTARPFLTALALAVAALVAAPAAAQDRGAEARTAEERRADAAANAAEIARAQAELRVAQEELERLSQRVGVLAQKAAAGAIERAYNAPPFARAAVGIVMAPDKDGVRLAAVTPGSPAAKAGLRGGDRLLRINGTALGVNGEESLEHARALIGELEEGDKVRIAYRRGKDTAEVELHAAMLPGLAWMHERGPLVPGDLPGFDGALPMIAPRVDIDRAMIAPFAACGEEGCDFGWFSHALRWRGLRLAEVDARLGRYFGVDRGVLVLKAEGKELDRLEPGDVILAIGDTPVRTPTDAMRVLGEAAAGKQVDIDVQRDHRRASVELTVPKPARWQDLVPPPPAPPAPPAPPRAARPPAAPSAPAPAATPRPPRPATPPAPEAPPAPPPPDEGILDRILM